MGDAIGQVLSLGVAVAISPVPIIAIVLMLATPRARSNGPAFLLGWILGLTIVGAIVLALASRGDASDDGEPATWVSWVKIGLGVLLLLVGVRQWRGRNKTAEAPKWMAAINGFTPPKALGTAALLSGVNPKNLLLTAGAGAAIAGTGVSTGNEVIALAIFIVIGSLGVIAPVAIYFALGERSKHILEGLDAFLAANNAVIMAVLILVIGVKLVGDGLGGLG